MKVKITRTIEIQVIIEAEILPGEPRMYNYSGCDAEIIDIEPCINYDNIHDTIYEDIEENKAELERDLIEEAEKLKEFNREL